MSTSGRCVALGAWYYPLWNEAGPAARLSLQEGHLVLEFIDL